MEINQLIVIYSALWLFFLIIGFITVRRLYRRNLNHQVYENYYNSLLASSPFMIITLDRLGHITSINPEGHEFLHQYGIKEIKNGVHIHTLFSELDDYWIESRFTEARKGMSETLVTSLNDKSGMDNQVNLTFIPVMIEGKPKSAFLIGKDITELRRYQRRIVNTQRDLQNTVRQQQGMIFKYIRKNNTFIHTLCDGELLYKLGLSQKEVLGKALHDFLPSKDADTKFLYYQKAWKGEITNYEGFINGVYYLTSLSPVIKNGQVVEVIGSSTDITDQKIMEEELRQKEYMYRTILNTMSEGIFIISADEKYHILNDNVERITGVNLADYPLSKLYEIADVQFITEEGETIPFEQIPFKLTLENGDSFNSVMIGVKHNGKIFKWFSVSSSPFVLEKQKMGALVSFNDLTLLKEQELKLRESYALLNTIIHNLETGIIVVDDQRKVKLMNQKFYQLFGLTGDISSFYGMNTYDLHHLFLDPSLYKAKASEIIENGVPISDITTSNEGKVLRRSYVPFTVADGHQNHLWTFEDITESEKMEQTIIKAKEEAEKANEAKSVFLSNMSHELRTPLNAILGFAQLLELNHSLNQTSNLNQQQQEFVQEILKGGRHLLALINEILDLSRIETGNLKISPEKVILNTIIDDCVKMMEPLASIKNVTIRKQVDACQDQYVSVDSIRIRQVFINLLDNAIKYNYQNGEIHVSCAVQDRHLIVHIKDTGIGIPVDERENIFEPFYRIHSIKVDGVGIGLAFAKQLIHLMGGEMGLESTIGEGSDFWIKLKLEDEYMNGDENIQGLNAITTYNHPKKFHILYIEDNESNLQLVKEIIRPFTQLYLSVARTGEEGIQKSLMLDIDLILLDIHLPDMDGYRVLKILQSKQLTASIPVIALTANAMVHDIEHALHIGFTNYLTKPLDVHKLMQVIEDVVRQK